jgi:hypothetical protein
VEMSLYFSFKINFKTSLNLTSPLASLFLCTFSLLHMFYNFYYEKFQTHMKVKLHNGSLCVHCIGLKVIEF